MQKEGQRGQQKGHRRSLSVPSFSRQPIGLFRCFSGLLAEVARTGNSGLMQF
jgi:hypothetical protein